MTSRSILANRNATERTCRTLKSTFSRLVSSHWTQLPMRSPHWSGTLSVLPVESCRRGALADAAIETAKNYLSLRAGGPPLTKYSSRDGHSFSILGAPRLPGFGKHGTQLDATDLFS